MSEKRGMKWLKLKTLLQSRGAHFVRQEGSHQIWAREEGDIQFQTTIPVPHNGHDFSGTHLTHVLRSLGFDTKSALEKVKPAPVAISKLAPEHSFGRRLYESRMASGLSQGDVARLAGIPQSQVSAWERGIANPFNNRWGPTDILNANVKRALIVIGERFGL